jgi:hypothetical protein
MKKALLLVVVLIVSVMVMSPDSQAVPSFARQVQKPCTACHTIWPNLNQAGRQFKVKAYTDVSEKWDMINKDNMNLTTVFPFSARVIFFPEVNDTGNPDTTVPHSSTTLDSVALFVASRVYDYAGVFGSAEFSPDDNSFGLPTVKLAFQYPLGEGNTVGLVVFKGLASGADPFNALGGRDRSLSWGDESKPLILTSGWTFNFSSEGNVGTVAHGYFFGNRLYAAIGGLRGGLSADAATPGDGALVNTTGNISDTDPYDIIARIAWDQKLPNGAVTVGAAYYGGTQHIISTPTPASPLIFPFDAKVKRNYVDVSLEQNIGEENLIEVQALYGMGQEENVFGGNETRKFDGLYLEASYFYDRKVGLVLATNNIKFKNVDAADPTGHQDKIDSWLASVNFLPWLNTKFAIQYVNTKTTFVDSDVEPDVTDKITRVVLDMVF